MELCLMSCGRLDGRRVCMKIDICIYMAESLHCSPETITTLLFSSTLIQNKKLNRKKKYPDKIMWITIISIFPIFCVTLDMFVTCHLWVSDLLSCSLYSEDCKLHQKIFSYVLDSSVLSDTLASDSLIYPDYQLL